MPLRETLERTGLGLLAVGGVLYLVVPVLSGRASCDSTVPDSQAQKVAYQDAVRRLPECGSAQEKCQVLVTVSSNGSMAITVYLVGDLKGRDCLKIDVSHANLDYDRDGKLIRCVGCAT